MQEERNQFQAAELAVCPYCGEKQGKRDGVDHSKIGNHKQLYTCQACHKHWRGPLPKPPSYPCPYCGGHCRRRGKQAYYEKRPSLLNQWLDRCDGLSGERKIKEIAQRYECTVCGRNNTELWLLRMPRKTPDGPFPFEVTLYLNLSSVRLLNARCKKTGMNYSQALRALFRNASYPKIGAAGGEVFGKPPALDKIPRLPHVTQLPNASRLPHVPGRRMLGPLLMYCVCLDKLAYYGLVRTMYREDMTRQEAARYLISWINPNG